MQVDDRRAGLEVRLTEGPYRSAGRCAPCSFWPIRGRARARVSIAPLARSPALSSPSKWPMPSPIDEQGAINQFLVGQQGVDAVVGHGCWLTVAGVCSTA